LGIGWARLTSAASGTQWARGTVGKGNDVVVIGFVVGDVIGDVE